MHISIKHTALISVPTDILPIEIAERKTKSPAERRAEKRGALAILTPKTFLFISEPRVPAVINEMSENRGALGVGSLPEYRITVHTSESAKKKLQITKTPRRIGLSAELLLTLCVFFINKRPPTRF